MKLSELFNPNEFAVRHLSFGDEAALLEALGEKSMDDFVGNTVPQSIRMPSELDLPGSFDRGGRVGEIERHRVEKRDQQILYRFGLLPDPRAERDFAQRIGKSGLVHRLHPVSSGNCPRSFGSFVELPTSVYRFDRFPVAGASLLDEATAAAEAMAMAHRVGKVKSERFFVDARVYPQTLDVMKTRAKYFGFELVVGDFAQADDGEYFGALFQYVGKDGDVQDLQDVIGRLKAKAQSWPLPPTS